MGTLWEKIPDCPTQLEGNVRNCKIKEGECVREMEKSR